MRYRPAFMMHLPVVHLSVSLQVGLLLLLLRYALLTVASSGCHCCGCGTPDCVSGRVFAGFLPPPPPSSSLPRPPVRPPCQYPPRRDALRGSSATHLRAGVDRERNIQAGDSNDEHTGANIHE
eukprot:GHVU01156864.1.p1 GENE.GHVU01156864.1~~GHVU01156864.1.p1  ORF type:complete len:123 (-),score=7.12 GHVU01156864.1:486-854(-)